MTITPVDELLSARTALAAKAVLRSERLESGGARRPTESFEDHILCIARQKRLKTTYAGGNIYGLWGVTGVSASASRVLSHDYVVGRAHACAYCTVT